MPVKRGEKHARAQSVVSRDPKRIRDDRDTAVSEMSLDRASHASPRQNAKATLTRKREALDTDDGEEKDESEEQESTTELGDEQEEEDALDDEAWLKKHAADASTAKGKGKVARTSKIDSPSKLKKRVKKGARDPYITSPPGSKARGKRRVDDSDDHDIGDEWTDLNGLRWKMGEDGQERREAIVQEMRLKYPNMPRDSRHPDAKLKVAVLVEKFLTEDEYEDMRAQKRLGFQEEERQREIEEADRKRTEAREQEELERRNRIAQSGGRAITTPKKIRNVQALYESPLRGSPSPSPLRTVLPVVTPSRSRSASDVSFKSASTILPSPSPKVPYKRLSLSMGSTGSLPGTPTEKEAAGSSLSFRRSVSTADAPIVSPVRANKSLRIPLSSPSPSSPSLTTPASTIRRMLGSLSSIVASRKREQSILTLLQTESEQRKKREASTTGAK